MIVNARILAAYMGHDLSPLGAQPLGRVAFARRVALELSADLDDVLDSLEQLRRQTPCRRRQPTLSALRYAER